MENEFNIMVNRGDGFIPLYDKKQNNPIISNVMNEIINSLRIRKVKNQYHERPLDEINNAYCLIDKKMYDEYMVCLLEKHHKKKYKENIIDQSKNIINDILKEIKNGYNCCYAVY